MYFFQDQAEVALVDPLILLSGLLAVAAVVGGFWLRRLVRRRPPRGPAYQVFHADVATAALWWGATQIVIVAGWALRVEGLRMPIWAYLGLLVGVGVGVLLLRRERRAWPALAKTDGVEQLPDGRVERGESQTGGYALVLAMGSGLATYLLSAGHRYGHPIHWITTGVAISAAYALGLAIWTPRFKVVAAAAKRELRGKSKRVRGSSR